MTLLTDHIAKRSLQVIAAFFAALLIFSCRGQPGQTQRPRWIGFSGRTLLSSGVLPSRALVTRNEGGLHLS